MQNAPTQSPPSPDQDLSRAVFEGSHDAILVIDPDGDRIVDANPRAATLLGYSRDELLRLPVSTVHPEEMARLRAFAGSVFRAGQGWTDELSCTTKGGCRLPSEISASVTCHGGERLLVAIVRDVSDRRRLEQALRERNEALAEANRTLEQRIAERTAALEQAHRALVEQERLAAIGTFAAGIAHEIRNPLGSIGMALDYALGSHPDERLARRLRLARQESERMEALLADMLCYARPQSLNPGPVHLGPLLDRCVEALAPALAGGRPRLRVTDTTSGPIQADGDKLQQVFLNLLKNAIEAAPEGGLVSVHLADGAGGGVSARVHNGGEPIPTALLARITEPFVSGKPRGTGLGLAIVRRLVEAHGGCLDIASSREYGTAVTVVLPAAPEAGMVPARDPAPAA